MDSVNCPALLTTFDFTALQQYLPRGLSRTNHLACEQNTLVVHSTVCLPLAAGFNAGSVRHAENGLSVT
jgi:hypothetical protein